MAARVQCDAFDRHRRQARFAQGDRGTTGHLTGRDRRGLGLHPPYVETWCTTAYSFGILEGTEDRAFQLAPHFDQILANDNHPRYLGRYVRLGAEFLFPVQTGFEELIWGNVPPTREDQEDLLRNAGFTGDIGRSIIGEGFAVLTVRK